MQPRLDAHQLSGSLREEEPEGHKGEGVVHVLQLGS
jgi:hypothetical protein